MRLIDADSFIQHLHEPMKYGYSLIDHIKNEPTVQMYGCWIPVKDRLPGRFDVVIAHFADGNIFTTCYARDPDAWDNHWFTHWMPLPEPPEVE